MGADWCHMDGAPIGLTTAMPRDNLTYNKNILRRRVLTDYYIILETALVNDYIKLNAKPYLKLHRTLCSGTSNC